MYNEIKAQTLLPQKEGIKPLLNTSEGAVRRIRKKEVLINILIAIFMPFSVPAIEKNTHSSKVSFEGYERRNAD